jgi:hypothetical protein
VHVRNVSALDHYTWCYVQSFRIANCAVVFAIFASRGIRVLLDAIWVKAGKTFELPSEATAIVAASEDLLAGIVHQGDAVRRAAHLLECRSHRWRWLCELTHAVSAFFHFFVFFMLLTSLPSVIRLGSTLRVCAENFPTRSQRATNSVLSHAFSCLFGDWLVVVIPDIQVNLALYYFHYIAAAARYEVWILGHKLCLDDLFELLIVPAHVVTELPVLDLLPAVNFGAANRLALLDLLNCGL